MHSQNPAIIHRDVKPENILLDANNTIKLCDFGWSNFEAKKGAERRMTMCGTPLYVAPEIIHDKGHGVGVDIWACGVLLFEMISGKTPFVGISEDTLFENITKLNVKWDLIPEVPRGLVQGIIQVKPEDRLSFEDILAHPYLKSVPPKENPEQLSISDLKINL